jgi:hypothetical protein
MKAAIEVGLSDFVPAVIFVAYSRARGKENIALRSEVIFGRLRTLARFEEC